MHEIKVNPSGQPNAVRVATDVVSDVHFPIYKMGFSLPGIEPVQVSQNAPMPVTEFYLEVAKGNVAGHSISGVSGRNASVGVAYEDIWGGGLLSALSYDAQTGNFTAGLTITGTTSGATGVVVADNDNGTTGTLTLRKLGGIFQDGETITDTDTGSATTDGTISSLGLLVYPTAGEQLEVLCENTNDDAVGTGARSISINYLDTDYNEQTETVALSGHTAALTSATNIFRTSRAIVFTWGDGADSAFGKSNNGVIIIRAAISKEIRQVIPYNDIISGDAHGFNVSRSSHFTVPAGKTAYLVRIKLNTSKNHEVETIFLQRNFGLDGFYALAETSVYQNSSVTDLESTPIRFAEKTDMKVIARSNNTSVDVNITYSILLVDD